MRDCSLRHIQRVKYYGAEKLLCKISDQGLWGFVALVRCHFHETISHWFGCKRTVIVCMILAHTICIGIWDPRIDNYSMSAIELIESETQND